MIFLKKAFINYKGNDFPQFDGTSTKEYSYHGCKIKVSYYMHGALKVLNEMLKKYVIPGATVAVLQP